jgi:hypothetical protein
MPAITTPEKSPILDRLAALRARTRVHLAIDGLASTALAFVTIGLVSFGIDRVFRLPWGQRAGMLAIMALLAGTLIWRRIVVRLRVALPLVELARAVEKMEPRLEWRLVSAVQFLEREDPRGSAELARLVIAEAEQAAAPLVFSRVLDTGAVARRTGRGLLTVACGLALVLAPGFRKSSKIWFDRCILLSSTAEWPKNTELTVTAQNGQVVTVLGNGRMRVAIPRGSDLAIIVSARGEVPTRATLAFDFAASHIRGTRPLARLGDNRFRHVFEKVVEDCDFLVRGGDDEVGPIHVAVVRPPFLDGLAIEADPPAYTKVPKKTFGIEAGEIALPAGTSVTITAHGTKPLLGAELDVRFAGTSLDAAPERHSFVSSTLLERRLSEARALEDARRPDDAARAYGKVVDLARARMSAEDPRIAPLDSYAARLARVRDEPEPEADKELALQVLLKDPRLAQALEPTVAATETLSFTFVLDKTAACSIDVHDSDELSLERPVTLTLRSVPDAPPKVQLQALGIGQIITPECTIPIEVKATDDYGLYSGSLKYKTASPNQKNAEGALAVPGVSDLKRDVDLPFDWDVSSLHLTPGTFLNFVCEVTDDDPKGRKSSISSSYALRIVAPEELLMDLIRRQHELRRELERLRDDESKLAEGLDTLDVKTQERAGKKQREVQKSVADAARAMTQVVDEMRNNKLLDERARTRLQDDVVTPLEGLRDGELVKARDLSDGTLALPAGADRDAKSRDAGASAREVTTQLDMVIAHLKRVADLAELVARLREFLKKERDLMEETRKQTGGQ